ncbi:MAG: S-malonyltransferase [Nocardia sp.]|uniref:acyltransferase domain-containing protein n=1 Tax=Nocardia sp. TaxID=1821 RepID=UPI002605B31E|nr:acyltransferase domain-containing protein [Nocardia sp.]MCU1647872.1 S-malonyltransferase [Nocardia sp.]
MTTSYLLGGQIPLTAASCQEFHDRYPEIRSSYEQASEWTGFSVSELLAGSQHEEREVVHSFSALRQAALVLGIHDVLAGRGIYPDAVGGLSLGGLISACLTGAVERQELFGLLHYHRLVPASPDPRAQGMAVAALPIDDDPESFYGERCPGVYLAADYEAAYGGNMHVIVLSGYVDALEKLVAEHPRKMQMLYQYAGAYHSPLVQYVSDFMEPRISEMTFRDPKITMFSSHSAGTVTTAEATRDYFLHNHVRGVGIKPLMTEVERIGTDILVGLGPGLPESLVVERLTMALVITPAGLDEASEALR